MSYALMGSVMGLDLPGNEKSVLMVLASFSNDDGSECYPAMSLIAARAGISSRSAQRMVRSLQKRGLIDVAGSGRGATYRYYLRQTSAHWIALEISNSEAKERLEQAESSGHGDRNSDRKLTKVPDTLSGSSAPDAEKVPDNLSEVPDNLSEVPDNLSGSSGQSVTQTSHEPVKEPVIEPANAHAREADLDEQKPKPVFVLPDWLPADAWNGWLEMRKKKKAPPTERACRLAVRQLEKLWYAGHDPGAVLDQSTMRGWTGLFPLKENLQNDNATNRPAGKPQYRRNPGFEMLRDAIAEERAQRTAADADAQADHLVTVDPLPLPARH